MTRTINTASIRLTTFIKAADKAKDKTIVYIEAIKGVYIKETNNIEETKKQDSCKRNAISTTNQAVSLLSILLKSKKGHIRSSVNILYMR